MRILLLSDIHANYPALKAVAASFSEPFDLIFNGGDTTVYGPFPNETIDWLRQRDVPSIIGNTDRLVRLLLRGETFAKPKKAEKRIMYGWTAAQLNPDNRRWLNRLPDSREVKLPVASPGPPDRIGTAALFHGSPADPDEFLFADTPDGRFAELAAVSPSRLVVIGHSHSPFYKCVGGVHFINPGSVGRMFDGNPAASCAVLTVKGGAVAVELLRVPYDVEEVVAELERQRLPPTYQEMYRLGRKLN